MGLARNDQKAQRNELQQLREENARLKTLLTQHGIVWEEKSTPLPETPAEPPEPFATQLSTAEKVAVFRRLFRGRTDVYPLRWESAKGTSGYSPACGNEWKPGVCRKPKVKCGKCTQRLLLQVTEKKGATNIS